LCHWILCHTHGAWSWQGNFQTKTKTFLPMWKQLSSCNWLCIFAIPFTNVLWTMTATVL
jgi:hypothetical protein